MLGKSLMLRVETTIAEFDGVLRMMNRSPRKRSVTSSPLILLFPSSRLQPTSWVVAILHLLLIIGLHMATPIFLLTSALCRFLHLFAHPSWIQHHLSRILSFNSSTTSSFPALRTASLPTSLLLFPTLPKCLPIVSDGNEPMKKSIHKGCSYDLLFSPPYF